ncbi:MAG: hypothetical protein WBQ34_09485 [Candidatus Acidiferrales bacterium]
MPSKRIDPAVRAIILQYALAFPDETYKIVAEVCGVSPNMVSYVMIGAGFHRHAPRKSSRRRCLSGCAVPSLPCIYTRIRNALRRFAASVSVTGIDVG